MGNPRRNEIAALLEAKALAFKASEILAGVEQELWCLKSLHARDVADLGNGCDIIVNGVEELVGKLQGDGDNGRAA